MTQLLDWVCILFYFSCLFPPPKSQAINPSPSLSFRPVVCLERNLEIIPWLWQSRMMASSRTTVNSIQPSSFIIVSSHCGRCSHAPAGKASNQTFRPPGQKKRKKRNRLVNKAVFLCLLVQIVVAYNLCVGYTWSRRRKQKKRHVYDSTSGALVAFFRVCVCVHFYNIRRKTTERYLMSRTGNEARPHTVWPAKKKKKKKKRNRNRKKRDDQPRNNKAVADLDFRVHNATTIQ